MSLKNIPRVKLNLLFLFMLLCQMGVAQIDSIDWSSVLSKNDLRYDLPNTVWEEGLFTGNGTLGTMAYLEKGNCLRVDIGRTDVVDHRPGDISPLYAKARLPIGHFIFSPVGKILKSSARLDLWNAEASGEIVTDGGLLHWRMLTLSQTDVIVVESEGTSGEKLEIAFVPEKSISPRANFAYVTDKPAGYTANPPAEFGNQDGVLYCRQAMSAGGDYATGWLTKKLKLKRLSYISIGYNNKGSSVEGVIRGVKSLASKDLKSLVKVHRNWWHNFYKQSFVSIPDVRFEQFYWIQQYKIGSAIRPGKRPLDLMGPWFKNTPWPAYWFNLNIQLSYSPLYTSNRVNFAGPLLKMVDDASRQLKLNVPFSYRHNALALGRYAAIDLNSPVKVSSRFDSLALEGETELGDLTWVLHNYWLSYRYTMDKNIKKRLIPLLKGSINYYLDVMKKGEDGKWHLPYTRSPEYPKGITRDCNYDLALFKWGCSTLLQLAPKDPLANQWKGIVSGLTPFPSDENGLRIGMDLPFATSHRHYSHLLSIYPLYEINWNQRESRELILKSLKHWHSFEDALQGYSYTGGASMYAMMGDGDQALKCLETLHSKYIKSNTMYLEAGPVIETPLAAATCLQELILQSWGNKIRIFPAVPNNWQRVSFKDLRAQGAFLVSAERKGGKTRWVRLKSVAGEPVVVIPNMKGKIRIKGRASAIQKLADGGYRLNLGVNEVIELYASGKS